MLKFVMKLEMQHISAVMKLFMLYKAGVRLEKAISHSVLFDGQVFVHWAINIYSQRIL